MPPRPILFRRPCGGQSLYLHSFSSQCPYPPKILCLHAAMSRNMTKAGGKSDNLGGQVLMCMH